jgi:hypothetical protein
MCSVQDLGFGVWGVRGSGVTEEAWGLRIQGLGSRVQGPGSRVQGPG